MTMPVNLTCPHDRAHLIANAKTGHYDCPLCKRQYDVQYNEVPKDEDE